MAVGDFGVEVAITLAGLDCGKTRKAVLLTVMSSCGRRRLW